MSDPESTNQIFNLAVGLDTLALGVSPSESLAVLGAVMAHSLGLAMYSAVSTQQQTGVVRNAAVTLTCTTLLACSVEPPNTPAMSAALGQPGPVKPEPDQAAAMASRPKALRPVPTARRHPNEPVRSSTRKSSTPSIRFKLR